MLIPKLTPNERVIKEEYEKDGWVVFKPSWPDFIMIKDGKIKLVEGKSVGDRLSQNQKESFELFRRLGWEVEIAYLRSVASGRMTRKVFDEHLEAIIGTRKRTQKESIQEFLSSEEVKAKVRIPAPVPNKAYIPGKVKFTQKDEEFIEEAVERREKEINEILDVLPKGSEVE